MVYWGCGRDTGKITKDFEVDTNEVLAKSTLMLELTLTKVIFHKIECLTVCEYFSHNLCMNNSWKWHTFGHEYGSRIQTYSRFELCQPREVVHISPVTYILKSQFFYHIINASNIRKLR